MKTFAIVFVALATVALSSRVAASPNPIYAPVVVPVASLKLGDLLKAAIASVVKQLVQLVSSKALAIIPGPTLVPVPALIATLKPLPSITVANLIITIGRLLGVNCSSVVALIPKVIANAAIAVASLVTYLLSSLPPNCTTVQFAVLVTVLGAYLDPFSVALLVNLLNSLS